MPRIVDAGIPSRGPAMARPVGVTVIAIVSLFVSFVFFCLIPAFVFIFRSMGNGFDIAVESPVPHPPIPHIFGSWWALLGFLAALVLMWSSIFLINGVGLLKLKNWARWLTIVLAFIQLAGSFRDTFTSLHSRDVAWLTFSAATIPILLLVLVYMFRPHVKDAFRAGVAAR